MAAVIVGGGGADAGKLPLGHRGAQLADRVERAVAHRPRADDGVYLVEEDDDLALGRLELAAQHGHPLGEGSAQLSARQQRAHVELDQDPILQQRHLVGLVDLKVRETLDDGGLADARLADQAGIIGAPLSKDVQDLLDQTPATDERLDLSVCRGLGEVAPERDERGERLVV